MTPEQIQELIDKLISTGEILATELFRIAQQQVMVKLVTNSIWAIAFIIAFIIVFKKFLVPVRKRIRKDEDEGRCIDEDDKWNVGISIVVLAIFMFIIIVEINTVLSYILNPEWYAIRLILGMF